MLSYTMGEDGFLMRKYFDRIHFTSFQIIIMGFSLVILIGSLLLMLPFARAGAGCASFGEALFTATSAVCVTGLVVQDTATYWSGFGQAVILALIQIGGMGVVTAAVAVAMVSGRKISLMQRSTMQEAIAAHHVGGIVKLTGFILKTTLIIELTGTVLLSAVFAKDFGPVKGAWYGLFHSVSAFCNAGFDLMGAREPFSSLTGYADRTLVNVVVMALIIVGGVGFLTWEDVKSNRWHFRAYRMQSKVILSTTGILLVLPALFFYFGEFARPEWSDMAGGERLLGALFQSVTPRTAGFNTVDLTRMSEVGRFLIIVLMLIGGSPGSTAGGMKTTTLAVLFYSAMSVFKRRETIRCFGRRIEIEAVRSAATILVLYLVLFLAGGLAISWIEDLPVLTGLFEAASAIGTVGLTLGITPQLCGASRVILIGLMFFGRVGGLTLIFAAASGKRPYAARLPKEKITVG